MRAREQRDKLAVALARAWRLAVTSAMEHESPIGDSDPTALLATIAVVAERCFEELNMLEEVKSYADRLFCKTVKTG